MPAHQKESTDMKKKKNIAARIIGCILLVVVLVAAVACLLYPNAAKAIFYHAVAPKIDLDENAEWNGGKTYMNIPYADVSASDYLDLYVPESEEKPELIVMVHGGGFIAGTSQTRQTELVYQYFRDHGYAVASVNYRLAQEACFPAAVQDVKAAVRFLRANAETYGYNADRITIMGESAGGYLASMAAVTSDDEFNDLPFIGEEELAEPVSANVQALIDFYGCVELGNFDSDWKALGYPLTMIRLANSWADDVILNGFENFESAFLGKNMSEMTEEEMLSYFPVTYALKNLPERDDIRICILHGDCDITVPMPQSQRFYEALQTVLPEDRLSLRIIPHAGHAADLIYMEEQLAAIQEFISH